jgi:AcrR family transcriptional regulator
MARPARLEEQRHELIPVVARAFAEIGYRRTTTAELARRCGVQETILYRLWPDKRAMFLAAIDFVFENTMRMWGLVSGRPGPAAAVGLLDYEAKHLGEFGLHRIVFAGLSEVDDAEVRGELARMYRRFHAAIIGRMGARRGKSTEQSAWALIALATFATIARELKLLSEADRRALLSGIGRRFLVRRRAVKARRR